MKELILLSLIFLFSLMDNGKKVESEISVRFEHSETSLDSIPKASYQSLTQVYNDESLANRNVTFRDERLLTSRTLESIYQMPVYKSKEEWEKRKQYLREHILVSAGLWPMPEKTALHPQYYHKVEHDDYIVETVSIQPYPGFYLAGNIYRPKDTGRFPAILTPHGHFEYGRLNNDEVGSIPGRCINFARQGYVVFSYDMVGYADTRQVPHTFADDSISGLYGINLLGLQLWNSIRALDFLTSLPFVDTDRIGVTGASGGGTQNFLLTAVDDRLAVTAPVNMVSNTMQGGDLCENAPGLRINTFNAEIASMAAPKPLLLVSNTYDWTFNTRNTIVPMVRSIYDLYDNTDDKLLNRHFDFQHNYNKASREAVYSWFGKWLLRQEDPSQFKEKPFQVDSDSDLLAFLKKRSSDRVTTFDKMPSSEYRNIQSKLNEEGLKQLLKDTYAEQLRKLWPADAAGLHTFKKTYGIAAQHLLGAEAPEGIDYRVVYKSKGEDFVATQILLSVKDKNNWIPCLLFQPLTNPNGTVILTSDNGKSDWVPKGSATPDKTIRKLLKEGFNVLVPDLFKQGEHVLQSQTKSGRKEADKFFTTYNFTDTQNQIQDLLTIIKAIKENHDLRSGKINLIATGNTGMAGLLLSSITNDINKFVLDGNQFNPALNENLLKLQIPGFMRIGGVKTILALAANKNLTLYNAHKQLLYPELKPVIELEKNKSHFIITSDNTPLTDLADMIR